MSLSSLRRLLGQSPKDEVGVVTAIGAAIVVACPSGTRSVSSSVKVTVGDAVLIVGGSIQSVVQRQEHLPHYYL